MRGIAPQEAFNLFVQMYGQSVNVVYILVFTEFSQADSLQNSSIYPYGINQMQKVMKSPHRISATRSPLIP
jgi:hypothetical protein